MKALCPAAVVLCLLPVMVGKAEDNRKAFPLADEGMVRFVLQLPPQEDEAGFKVQLLVGQTVEVDERNRSFFGGKIEEVTIEGWGFPRYIVRELGPMAGTLIAVDPDTPKVARFVTLRGDPHLIRYNSRLPVVVYVPEGVEVRYRIWKAGDEVKAMDKG